MVIKIDKGMWEFHVLPHKTLCGVMMPGMYRFCEPLMASKAPAEESRPQVSKTCIMAILVYDNLGETSFLVRTANSGFFENKIIKTNQFKS